MTITIHGRCWSCVNGIDASTDETCEKCAGTGIVPVSRNDAWTRRREFLGRAHPLADKNTGWEKWAKVSADVPPELMQALEEAQRKSLGVNWDGYKDRPTTATRANLVRAALRMYLNKVDPEDWPTEANAEEGSAIEVVGEIEGARGQSTTRASEMRITITVPGSVWYDNLDPLASGMQAELGLPDPAWRKVGKGHQAIYSDITLDQAAEVADYIIDRGGTLLSNTEPDERHVLRAAIRTGERINAQVAAARVDGA